VIDPANMNLWVHDVDEPGNWINDGSAADRAKSLIVDTVQGPYPILITYEFAPIRDGSATEPAINLNARSDSSFTAVLFVLTGWFAKWFMKRCLRSELEDVKREIEKL